MKYSGLTWFSQGSKLWLLKKFQGVCNKTLKSIPLLRVYLKETFKLKNVYSRIICSGKTSLMSNITREHQSFIGTPNQWVLCWVAIPWPTLMRGGMPVI
jgi:hypothetical protein